MNTLKKMELNIPSKARGIYNQDLVHNTLEVDIPEFGQAEFWLANTVDDDFNCEALFLKLNGKVICLTPETTWYSSENNEYIEMIRTGNERVLSARLADAAFFFAEDKKLKLIG